MKKDDASEWHVRRRRTSSRLDCLARVLPPPAGLEMGESLPLLEKEDLGWWTGRVRGTVAGEAEGVRRRTCCCWKEGGCGREGGPWRLGAGESHKAGRQSQPPAYRPLFLALVLWTTSLVQHPRLHSLHVSLSRSLPRPRHKSWTLRRKLSCPREAFPSTDRGSPPPTPRRPSASSSFAGLASPRAQRDPPASGRSRSTGESRGVSQRSQGEEPNLFKPSSTPTSAKLLSANSSCFRVSSSFASCSWPTEDDDPS